MRSAGKRSTRDAIHHETAAAERRHGMPTMAEGDEWPPLETVVVGGVALVTASRQDLTDAMVRDCLAARSQAVRARLVFDLNGQALSLRETDAAYRAAFDQGDILHADGGFLVTLSRWLAGVPIAERSPATDLINDFSARAATEGLTFYLLGGSEEVNAACARILVERYPGLKIAGRHNGYFSEADLPELLAEINAAAPDVLWVGLGKQIEVPFAIAHRDLRAGWLVTSGGCFNYVTGHYRRAPLWMQRMNLEWVHRMVTNPRQLLMRYLLTTPHALYLGLSRTPRQAGRRASGAAPTTDNVDPT
jgi:N-acetylglucosaminyldiphosphoundecaprenol N-acetyl-beta-D-mannosaminyltransferase